MQSTCRLVDFLFDRAERGAQPLLGHVPVHNLLRLTCGGLTRCLDVVDDKDGVWITTSTKVRLKELHKRESLF
jgi:hypothetical protein